MSFESADSKHFLNDIAPLAPPFRDDFKGRLYFLPFAQDEICLCGKCFETGGFSEKKSREEIYLSLKKAKKSEYQGVLFPCYLISQHDVFDILRAAKELGLIVFVQLSVNAWLSPHRSRLMALIREGVEFNIILGQASDAENEFVGYIHHSTLHPHYTLVGVSIGSLAKYIAQLPQFVLDRLHFYFPLDPIETRRMFLTSEIYQSLQKISSQVRKAGKHLEIRGPKGVDIYEPYIPNDRDLEPDLDPLFSSMCEIPPVSAGEIEVSVIVPTFNCRDYILNVVRHLFKQDLPPQCYEIIVVDDGSTDDTQKALHDFLKAFEKERNFQYLFFSRLGPRKRGDSQFRAGIARNAGVKQAKGRLLLFLDSDMLVPSHYLSDLIKKMESFDIIQGRRLFLNEEVSNRLTSYELIDTEIDTYAEDPYWDAFQKTEDWNSLHNHWKYTCTHSLAVRKADFKRLGWFRKTFLFYGFEDVDLGYRFAKDGARFLLNDKAIFHLHPPPSQSEYERSPARRQTILAKTCRIFFHHSLDEAAFNDFRGLLTPSHSFSIELPRINPRSAFFWLHHSFQMVKWRLMWFFFHPAPKAGIQLTGGLLRRAYWRLIWPTMCWFYWRIKVLATWVYWRTYGLAGLVRWRIWGLLKWKLAMPLYYKGGLSLRKIYYYGFERIFWKFVWPCLCWSRWRTTGLANKIYWRTRVLISRLYWRLYASINFFYYHILVRGFWLIFKLSLPLRKPFYILMFQYRKRILRLPEYQKE